MRYESVTFTKYISGVNPPLPPIYIHITVFRCSISPNCYNKTQHWPFFFQEVMKGVQMMYDITKFRRPSNMFGGVPDSQSGFPPTSPSTPALSVYTIDDEFNLPVSVAFMMLVVYIVIGAIMFCFEEGWGFFESFYFVFISMSTIGFGDFVPKVRRWHIGYDLRSHPIIFIIWF